MTDRVDVDDMLSDCDALIESGMVDSEGELDCDSEGVFDGVTDMLSVGDVDRDCIWDSESVDD